MTSKVIEGHKSSIIKKSNSLLKDSRVSKSVRLYPDVITRIYYYERNYERKFFYISLKNTVLDFSFFLSNAFIYEPILIKISMNANIMKTQS